MTQQIPRVDIRKLYDQFKASVTEVDCGAMCAPHNPSGKPFCCDICHAVPAAYHQEWEYLQRSTDLWHEWRGDECAQEPTDKGGDVPESMRLLACKGPSLCQRNFRALSCRQFPFFPYITADYRFIGLAYDWTFERNCWVISNLNLVTEAYRQEFVQTYDDLFNVWIDEMESYAILSEQMRAYFAGLRRRIPILHRNGGFYLLSPISERLQRVPKEGIPTPPSSRYSTARVPSQPAKNQG